MYKHLRVFGCEAFYPDSRHFRDKLASNSKKCVFLGYSKRGEIGFCLLDLDSKKILQKSYVHFTKEKMHKKPIKIVEICRVVI